MRGYSSLNETCQREMSRAVRLALWDFQKGGALTGVCDEDVGSVCQARLRTLLREHMALLTAIVQARCTCAACACVGDDCCGAACSVVPCQSVCTWRGAVGSSCPCPSAAGSMRR